MSYTNLLTPEFIEEIKRRFPSGCSYYHVGGNKTFYNLFKNVFYTDKDIFQTTSSTVAIGAGKGLIYDDGEWAELINDEKKEDEQIKPQYEIY